MPPPATLDFLADDDASGADVRAEAWAFVDPFPNVNRSLLSSVAIRNYARVTGMVHPYSDKRLKAASYEVGMGGTFIMWRDGNREDRPIEAGGAITLPPNSISFVQTDVKFRLPHYMGLRFNLQIAHVHRGILLGTGPLVDPGFEGVLLIPLHNLTSSPYTIPASEPLIWIEFTKTTFGQEGVGNGYDETCHPEFLFPNRKKNQTPDYYLVRANKGNPIASSIPDVIAESAEQARQSAANAQEAKADAASAKTLAESADRKLFRIGIGSAIAAIIAVIAIYITALGTVQDAASAIRDAEVIVKEAQRNGENLRKEATKIESTISRVEALERTRSPTGPQKGLPNSTPSNGTNR